MPTGCVSFEVQFNGGVNVAQVEPSQAHEHFRQQQANCEHCA